MAQPNQPPQPNMGGSQLVQWLSVQAGNMAGDLQHNVRALMVRASSPMLILDGHDSVLKDRDFMAQRLTQELANQKEHSLAELERALQDAERGAEQVRPVLDDVFSTQPYATLVEKKTFQAVAAVARAVPVQGHSPAISLGASTGNLNLRAKNEGRP